MKLKTKLLKFDQAQISLDEDTGRISGYGSVFGNIDLGGDIVMPGAFKNSLQQNPNVKMLWGHDPYSPPWIVTGKPALDQT